MGTQAGRPAPAPAELSSEEQHVVQLVLSAIRQIRHGYVQLILQDGRVVQVDRLEKRRLASQRLAEPERD